MERSSGCIGTASYDRESGLELYRLRGCVPAFPPHFHRAYLLGLLSDGCRTLFLRGRSVTLEVGSVVLLSPGEGHACCASAAGQLDFRGFHASPRCMGHWLGASCLSEGRAFRFSRPVTRDGSLYRVLLQLHRLLMGEDDCCQREALFLEAAYRLLRYVQADAPGSGYGVSRSSGRLEGVCSYMRGTLTEPLSLSQLARSVGMSRPTLHRCFAEEKGISPCRYRESLRVEHARRCLRGGMSPTDVAQLLGYADQSHFSRRFRALMGFPPGHYRGVYEGKGGFHAL